jgi:hypothetical protein
MKSVAAITICSINYITKAMVMLSSYRQHHPQHSLYLIVVDKKSSIKNLPELDAEVIWAEDLGIPNFLQYAFMYDVIEFNTNVKPFALSKILKNHDAVVYLDPDIKVYAPLTPVFEALDTASLVVTPHANTPIIDGNKPDDLELLKFGAFNLGFVGVSNCQEGFDFLNWWSDRCLSYGFYEPQMGLGVDQKWVSLAPCFFPTMQVLHDTGLNVAFWNLHERTLSKVNGQWLVNQNTPLKFVHFSSFDAQQPENIANKQSRFLKGSRPDFTEVAIDYAAELRSYEIEAISSTRYSFDYFEDGTYITPALKRFYAALKNNLFSQEINPFSINSNVMQFAKKQGLLLKNNSPSKRHTFKDMGSYSYQIKIINKLLRFILFVLGPERYFNLMRYLAHISSLRNQSGLFGND